MFSFRKLLSIGKSLSCQGALATVQAIFVSKRLLRDLTERLRTIHAGVLLRFVPLTAKRLTGIVRALELSLCHAVLTR